MIRSLLILTSVLITFKAFSMNFSISPVLSEIETDESKVSSSYFTVKSNTYDTLYLKVYAKKIINPKLATESEHEIEGNSELVISPGKLIVRPFEQKKVRAFIQHGDKKIESLYKIYFEQVSDFEQYDNYPDKEPNGALPIKYILSALIKAMPSSSKAILSSEKDAIVNSGTRHIRITYKCVFEGKENCTWEKVSPYFHLYPSNEILWESDFLNNVQAIKYIIPPHKYEHTLYR